MIVYPKIQKELTVQKAMQLTASVNVISITVSLKINPSHKTDTAPKARPMATLNQEKGLMRRVKTVTNAQTRSEIHTLQVRPEQEI